MVVHQQQYDGVSTTGGHAADATLPPTSGPSPDDSGSTAGVIHDHVDGLFSVHIPPGSSPGLVTTIIGPQAPPPSSSQCLPGQQSAVDTNSNHFAAIANSAGLDHSKLCLSASG